MSTSGTYWEKDCDYCNQDFFTGERRGDKTQLGKSSYFSLFKERENITIFDNMSSCVCIFYELRQGSAWEIQMHTRFRTSCHKYLRLQMGGFALDDLPVCLPVSVLCIYTFVFLPVTASVFSWVWKSFFWCFAPAITSFPSPSSQSFCGCSSSRALRYPPTPPPSPCPPSPHPPVVLGWYRPW